MPVDFDDYLEIRELTARYNLAADTNDLEGYADCFTEDGVFEIAGLATLEGRDQLAGLIASFSFPTHHTTTDPTIDVTGDCGAQVCSFVLYGQVGEDVRMQSLTTGRYRDDLVRTPEGWRFARRVVAPDNDLAQMLVMVQPQLVETLGALTG